MKTTTPLFGVLAAAGLALMMPVFAQAASGYLSVNVNLRAGPAIDYPSVYVAPRGTAVEVYGCIDSWEWCDVSWDGYRGWVSSNYLNYGWNGRRVPVHSYGPRIGLSIVSFNVATYWNSHYRNRSWYGQRDRYQQIAKGKSQSKSQSQSKSKSKSQSNDHKASRKEH